MAGFVASKVAKHILKENAQNRFGTEDPYFDHVTPYDLNGNPGKVKKTKKATPPGLTASEAKTLKKVTRRAYRLDNCFSICGIRIGWSAIFGFIPVLGDFFDVLMALMVYRTICQVEGLPATLKSRMMMNIVIDFAVGLVPLLGDVADALYRANTRNASLLYLHLKERGEKRAKGEVIETSPSRTATGQQKILPPPAAAATAATSTHGAQHKQHQQQVLSPSHHSHQHQQPITTNKHTPTTAPTGQTSGTIARNDIQAPTQAKSKGSWLSRFTGGDSTTTAAAASSSPAHTRREPDLEAGERKVLPPHKG